MENISSDCHSQETCCLCGNLDLRLGLSLASTPPANEFVKEDVAQDVFPLEVFQCYGCGHIQLGCIVNPERLFRNYVYVSGTSPSFVKHFDDYSQHIIEKLDLLSSDVILEIGSNDGTLLNCFAQRGFKHLYGIEPAVNIAIQAQNNKSFTTIPEFFDEHSVSTFKKFAGPNANLVVANNVFAHSSDLIGIINNIKQILSDDGVFVFEVSYFIDVLQKCLFDTIYHEHCHYHTIRPLAAFFERNGLKLFDVEHVDTHGGSIRCYVSRPSYVKYDIIQNDSGLDISPYHVSRTISKSVYAACETEKQMGLVPDSGTFYPLALHKFANDIKNHKEDFRDRISILKNNGAKIVGYGAPAKATTLMYEFGISSEDISFIIDDSPLKQGLLTPGKHVPVISSQDASEIQYDCLVILAWNFAEQIMKKNSDFARKGGVFINPIEML